MASVPLSLLSKSNAAKLGRSMPSRKMERAPAVGSGGAMVLVATDPTL